MGTPNVIRYCMVGINIIRKSDIMYIMPIASVHEIGTE